MAGLSFVRDARSRLKEHSGRNKARRFMEFIPAKFWLILGLTGTALLINALYPLLAALLGIVAILLFLWLLVGGGK